jgi:hypothetical protein
MNRTTSIFCFLVIAFAALIGCSSKPKEAAKAEVALDKIQGKAQTLQEQGGANDAALNAGGPSVYIWEGTRRYRLFFRTPVEVVHGDEYVVEGVNAQKIIDDLGDPDQGKNGYPLATSCTRVVKTAWSNLAFDTIDAQAEVLRARVKRYPARPVFLVSKIRLVTPTDASASKEPKKDDADKNLTEVSVAAEKQRTFLVEGPAKLIAPLWEPTGGKVLCKVVIGPDGKISDMESGTQLCETVAWSQFKYQPPVAAGHPVKVRTEVEVKFEPRT